MKTLLNTNSNQNNIEPRCVNYRKLKHKLDYFKVDNNLSEIDTEIERIAARKNLGILNGQYEWGNINGHIEDQKDLLELLDKMQRKITNNNESINDLKYRNPISIHRIVPNEPYLYSLQNIIDGALYAVGPINDQEDPLYKIYVYINNQWNYMGYLNSAHIDMSLEIGDSSNLTMSQKAIKNNFISSTLIRAIDTSHTQKELEQMLLDGTCDANVLYLVFE